MWFFRIKVEGKFLLFFKGFYFEKLGCEKNVVCLEIVYFFLGREILISEY